jgi:hypothetical protein
VSYPTLLGPWFVVQRLYYAESDERLLGVEYYQHPTEGEECWTRDKRSALLFMSIQQASRIASAETAEVRALTTKEEAKEFDRG